MHALLVEDQTLIALDTETMLRELGVHRVDSFTTLDSAMAWLQSATPHVAVLDINLGEADCFPIADDMLLRGVPFLFTTGYGEHAAIPERFRHAPVVQKPYSMGMLAAALVACLRTGGL